MKKIALLALAATIATPSMAQTAVTGTINITGTVAGKCSVVPVSGDGSTFTANVAMGELAATDGTLKATGTLATTFGTAGGSALSVRVVCTTATPTIAVDADPLVSATAAPTGYANTVHYRANVLVAKATTASQTYTNDSDAAASSAVSIGDRLAATGNNVTVSTSDWHTPALGELLVAATDYSGKIVVTIAPGA